MSSGCGNRSAVRTKRGERAIWQRRFWEHAIRDGEDYARHLDYIHYNPVKHGWATRVQDWPYSTFHRFVQTGISPVDWVGNGDENLACGERGDALRFFGGTAVAFLPTV